MRFQVSPIVDDQIKIHLFSDFGTHASINIPAHPYDSLEQRIEVARDNLAARVAPPPVDDILQ